MLFASSCPEENVHQVSRFIFLACSSQIPTTPLLMVQICFLVPLTEFIQMLGLMALSGISISGLLLPVKCHLKIKFSSREFSGFSVSLKIRYFQLVQLKSVHQFLFCLCVFACPFPPSRTRFFSGPGCPGTLDLTGLELRDPSPTSVSQVLDGIKVCRHHQAVLFFLIKMF